MSLDVFLAWSSKTTAPEERCSNPRCRKIIKGIKYSLTVKGQMKTYCQECAKKILRPLEPSEASL